MFLKLLDDYTKQRNLKIQNFLKKIILFKDKPFEFFHKLLDNIKILTYKDSDIILKEGDIPMYFYILR